MAGKYTNEESTLVLLSLMKAHGVRRVIASPGMRNMPLVASLQHDADFKVYSCVDERSAAYMACGMAAQTGEPVALSCTGATASRNYMPGLTEAFYRKLPVLAITSAYHEGELYQLKPQSIDRRSRPNDLIRMSVEVPMVLCEKDRRMVELRVNSALLELKRDGGGPVHINLETRCSRDLSVAELPHVRAIERHTLEDNTVPAIPEGKVGVFVGSHARWNTRLAESVDRFCGRYGAVVFCNHASNYQGRFRVNPTIVSAQENWRSALRDVNLLVHVGEVSGAPFMGVSPKDVWRVSPDGDLRDTFGKLSHVFQMNEETFFELYASLEGSRGKADYLEAWQMELSRVRAKIPELPLSNGWVAQQTLPLIPDGSVVHLGIYNTLRMWGFFEPSSQLEFSSNTGGFGIDGAASTALGAALADSTRLFFCVLGDLAFFYDMNSLGNRHVPSTIRMLLVNNGLGVEFRNYGHPSEITLHEEANPFVAAAGHFSNKGSEVVRHFATDMGFEYMRAATKGEYLSCLCRFVDPQPNDKPMLLEVLTTPEDEYAALKALRGIEQTPSGVARSRAKKILGEHGTQLAKKVLGKR